MDISRQQRTPSGRAMATLVVLSLVGCQQGPLDTEPLTRQTKFDFINPSLDTLGIGPGLRTGLFRISALPSDYYNFRAQPSERARITVTSDRGENEEILIGPYYCPRPSGGDRKCREFTVDLKNNRDILDLNVRELGVQAVLTGGMSGYPWGIFELVDGTLDGAIASVRKHRLVAHAEDVTANPNDIMIVVENHLSNHMAGAAFMEYAEPTPRDGIVQVLDGDVVLVEYIQPDGRRKTFQQTISCQRPPGALFTIPEIPCR